MEKSNLFKPERRDFLTKVVPACSVLCFGAGNASALISPDVESDPFQDKHKFEKEHTFGRKMTFRQYYSRRFNNKFIPIMQEMANQMEKEKFLEILKKASYEANLKLGQRIGKRINANDLSFFPRAWLNPSVDFKHSMTYEIIENTKKAFEVKVTECLTELIFREAGAQDIGFAGVCYADYSFPIGLYSKIKLVRDKTLMQGHDCCNHRYVLKE